MRSGTLGVRWLRALVVVAAGVALGACGNDGPGESAAKASSGSNGTADNVFDIKSFADATANDAGSQGSDVVAGVPDPDTSNTGSQRAEDTDSAASGDPDASTLAGDDTGDTVEADATTSADTAPADDAAPANDTASADTAPADDAAPANDTVSADDTSVAADAGNAEADTGSADTAAPAPKVVRFAALGDAGTGSAEQYAVGKALGDKCKQSGCDFVLYLGDNFYDTGVKDENDKQFAEKFEKPYETVDAPFYVVLGNHDYGAGGAGAEFLKKDFYVKYSKKNPKFHLPDAWWNVQVEHVHFFALDSNALLYGDVLPFIIQKQLAEVDAAIKASTAPWKISFAHHPMRSNGPHGNAGCYEGAKAAPIPQLCGVIPVASGKGVKEAYEKLLCGRVDVHLSGHDHSRQWLDKAASTKFCKDVELLISGGGAKTTNVETKTIGGYEFNPFHFQDADKSGFLYVEITGDNFKGQFIDSAGKVEFERSFQRTPK